MAKDRAAVRQRRGGAAADEPPSALQQRGAADGEPTPAERVNFYVAQYAGAVCCVLGILLLCVGYDREWVHNTTLCLLSMGLCLLGWFFHELRPFNAQAIFEEEQKAKQAQ
ncbi:hypothetical protein HT031_004417 [Scenedesmus sp. PABB004]|nr:hypothetical protein HT031_004417 [Scenedesmus sp. PABB004]